MLREPLPAPVGKREHVAASNISERELSSKQAIKHLGWF